MKEIKQGGVIDNDGRLNGELCGVRSCGFQPGKGLTQLGKDLRRALNTSLATHAIHVIGRAGPKQESCYFFAMTSYKKECRVLLLGRLFSTHVLYLNHGRTSEKYTKSPFMDKLLPSLLCVYFPSGLS